MVHVFDASARSHMALGSADDHDIEEYLARQKARAAAELAVFMRDLEFIPALHVLKVSDTSTAHVICATARELSAELILVGTRGRTAIAKFLLGSVADEVLHISDRDVLAVPPGRPAD